jgi:hypothetical protein
VQEDDADRDLLEERFVNPSRADEGAEGRMRGSGFQNTPYLLRKGAIDE